MCARLAPWDLNRTTSLRPLSSVGTADVRCQKANIASIRFVGLKGAETLGEFFHTCARHRHPPNHIIVARGFRVASFLTEIPPETCKIGPQKIKGKVQLLSSAREPS